MARPIKDGLDYFPLNTDFEEDDKVAIIEAQYGNTGHSFMIRLLCRIYKHGYYYHWTEKEQLLLSKKINVDINQVRAMVNDCIKWGFFDSGLFDRHRILTSQGIQKRYLEATLRRQEVRIYEPYLLLSQNDLKKYKNLYLENEKGELNKVNVYTNPSSPPKNDHINTQSKVKESKGKENKEKESKEHHPPLPTQEQNDVQRIITFWDNNGFGFNNTFVKDQKLLPWLDEPQFKEAGDMVLFALEIASTNNKRNINYVEAILKNWFNAGCQTLSDAQNQQQEFKQQFQKQKGASESDWEAVEKGLNF